MPAPPPLQDCRLASTPHLFLAPCLSISLETQHSWRHMVLVLGTNCDRCDKSNKQFCARPLSVQHHHLSPPHGLVQKVQNMLWAHALGRRRSVLLATQRWGVAPQVDPSPLLVHLHVHVAAHAAGGFPRRAVLCGQVSLVGLVAIHCHDPTEQVRTGGNARVSSGGLGHSTHSASRSCGTTIALATCSGIGHVRGTLLQGCV